MSKPLQRVTVGFLLATVVIAALSVIISRQAPRTIGGFLLPFLFPLLLLGFGFMFVGALRQSLSLPTHPVLRFAMPIVLTLVLLACSLLIGLWLASLLHRFGA